MSLLILSAADVAKVTSTFSPTKLQELMAQVFYSISHSNATQKQTIFTPHRTRIPMQDHLALFMPARVARSPLLGTSMKVVSVPTKSGDTRGLPASTIVMDEDTGAVKALVNARSLTALRNAAGSLLSSDIVGLREPSCVVAFGAGSQIEAHLDLHLRHFPSISSCTIINRTLNSRVTALNSRLSPRFPHVTFTFIASSEAFDNGSANVKQTSDDGVTSLHAQIRSAVQSAQLIICATSSTTSLFPSSWVRDGAHVILIGSYTPAMREVDRELIQRAINTGWKKSWDKQLDRTNLSSAHASTNAPDPENHCIPQILMVDSREACALEAGELIDAGVAEDVEKTAEIGELVYLNGSGGIELQSATNERAPIDSKGNGFDGPITMFKSVGVGLQDVAIACAVVEKAGQMGIGVNVQDYDA